MALSPTIFPFGLILSVNVVTPVTSRLVNVDVPPVSIPDVARPFTPIYLYPTM